MARNPEQQPVFDISAYMPDAELPPLVPVLEAKNFAAKPLRSTAPESDAYEAPRAQTPPPTVTPPRLAPIIPVSYDDRLAWQRAEAARINAARPQLPFQATAAPRGLFAPALPSAPSRPQLPAAPAPRQLQLGSAPEAAARVDNPISTKKKESTGSSAIEESTPVKLVEIIKKRKRLSAGIGAVAAILIIGGVSHGGGSMGDMTAEAAAQQYPVIGNEAINCDTPAEILSLSSTATIKIPITFSEAGHKDSYMTMDATVTNVPVSVDLCGVRKQNAAQTLATYDTQGGAYIFDRQKTNLTASEKSFGFTAANAFISQPTGVYMDGKELPPADIAKHPFSPRTNTLLAALINQDPKTKHLVYTSQMSRLVLTKLEEQGLTYLQDPQACGNTQTTADQAIGNYIRDQFSKKSTNANDASKLISTGKNSYGSLVNSFMSNKETANFVNSPILSLINPQLKGCDAELTTAPKSSPTKTSKKG